MQRLHYQAVLRVWPSTQQPCVIWELDEFADQNSVGWRGEEHVNKPFESGLSPEDAGVSFLLYPE